MVTGAAHGLGRAIAERLAGEGASVILGDVDGAGLERVVAANTGAGGRAAAVAGDVTEEEGAARLIGSAMERGGRLDLLVNNVGVSRNARIWEMAVEDWDFVLRLNLRSTFLCTRAAVPHMMRRRYGRIVCLSSGAREGTPWTAYYQGGSAYSAAKAGVHGFISRRRARARRARDQRERGDPRPDRHRTGRDGPAAPERHGGVQSQPHDAAAPAGPAR